VVKGIDGAVDVGAAAAGNHLARRVGVKTRPLREPLMPVPFGPEPVALTSTSAIVALVHPAC
jgi:hypothetical protein